MAAVVTHTVSVMIHSVTMADSRHAQSHHTVSSWPRSGWSRRFSLHSLPGRIMFFRVSHSHTIGPVFGVRRSRKGIKVFYARVNFRNEPSDFILLISFSHSHTASCSHEMTGAGCRNYCDRLTGRCHPWPRTSDVPKSLHCFKFHKLITVPANYD